MHKIKCLIVLLFTFHIFNFVGEAFAWEPTRNHKDFSRYAAENSVLDKSKGDYLKNLGFDKGLDDEKLDWSGWKTLSIKDWLAEGADLEDSSTKLEFLFGDARPENHFHNPLKTWPQAGLNDIKTGESSLLWAQDATEQEKYREGDWSWNKVRQVYYWALISTTNTLRQVNFAQTFKGLGHQMHIIQDAAQPEHARNDVHISSRFEAWAAEKLIL